MPRPPVKPAFLSKCPAYDRYLLEVPEGSCSLPPFEEDDKGVKIYPGEIFCRIEDCPKGVHPLSKTTTLRYHVRGRHGKTVSPYANGSLKPSEKDESVRFYKGLFSENGGSSASPTPVDSQPEIAIHRSPTNGSLSVVFRQN